MRWNLEDVLSLGIILIWAAFMLGAVVLAAAATQWLITH